MKKLLIGLSLLMTLPSFANGNYAKGVVGQTECNSETGLGVVELITRDG